MLGLNRDSSIDKLLVEFLYQRQLELIEDNEDPIQFAATCYGLVADDLVERIGEILTTRIQGVDCGYCEDSQVHTHIRGEGGC